MIYENITEGVFISRPNRFIAYVLIDGKEEKVHVKNTGRLGELLYEGARVFVQKNDSKTRKTKYDLISVYKGDVLYNIDSQSPNKLVDEFIREGGLFKNITYIKPEYKYKDSRLDFYVEYDGKRALIEVKGVTKEEDGVLLFPDAPTERGIRHINHLSECVEEGYEAYIVFVICANAGNYFTSDKKTHPDFARALKEASENGVKVLALNCFVERDRIKIKDFIDVKL